MTSSVDSFATIGYMKGTSLLAVTTVDESGGTLQINDTDVKLEIPRDALDGGHEIQIRIVPNCLLVDEQSQSFCSNSSVVVDILPSDLRLKLPATLTLPHCLVLNRDEVCKADLYSCSHREGTYVFITVCAFKHTKSIFCLSCLETCVSSLINQQRFGYGQRCQKRLSDTSLNACKNAGYHGMDLAFRLPES